MELQWAHKWSLLCQYSNYNSGKLNYFIIIYCLQVESTWRMKEQFVVRDVQGALAADATETTHPMTIDVTSPSSIRSIFDSIAYEKGNTTRLS
jgi:Aminopeptidase N